MAPFSRLAPGLRRASAVALALAAAGCASTGPAADPRSVTIERTEFHVAHVTAQSYEALAYGTAYAHAEDWVCATLDNLLTARGERSRYLGGDTPSAFGLTSTTNARIDLFVRSHMDDAALAAASAGMSDDAKAAARG